MDAKGKRSQARVKGTSLTASQKKRVHGASRTASTGAATPKSLEPPVIRSSARQRVVGTSLTARGQLEACQMPPVSMRDTGYPLKHRRSLSASELISSAGQRCLKNRAITVIDHAIQEEQALASVALLAGS